MSNLSHTNMKTFVVAGNKDQAMTWIRNDINKNATTTGIWKSLSDYIIVHRPEQIRGFSDPHGVFVGTWKARADIKDIVELLIVSSTTPNESLINIRKDL